jgi:hypothetical protein
MSKITERIERELGLPDLVSLLAERIPPTDLQSLLLEVYRTRARSRKPSDVLADYQSDRFVRPADISPARLNEWEGVAFSQLAPEFELLALSPLCPLGTNSVVAKVDQNWAVSTIRNSEVVSDSTNVLALECALRRRHLLRQQFKSATAVHLATSHRLVRGQHYRDPKLLSHFSALVLCSAGRDVGSLRFEMRALVLHIRTYVRALRAFLGPELPLRLSASDFAVPPREAIVTSQLIEPLRNELGIEGLFDGQRTSGRGYYSGLCFHLQAMAPSGRWLEIVDGGAVDWTQQLLSDAKERLVISGIGSERVCTEFTSGNVN